MIENHVFGKIWLRADILISDVGPFLDFFEVQKQTTVSRCPKLIWIAKRGASLSQNMFTSFFWVPLNATISSIDFNVKSYDFIDDLYHSANPVLQNKVKKNHRLVSWFHSFIDSYHFVIPMWQKK